MKYTLTHDERGWTPCRDGTALTSHPFATEIEAQLYAEQHLSGQLKQRGRPPMHDVPMRQTAVWFRPEQIVWLKAQAGSMSETMRSLVDQAMK